MRTFSTKVSKEFKDALPIFIFFTNEHIKVDKQENIPILIKSKFYNTQKMFYTPYHKPLFLISKK